MGVCVCVFAWGWARHRKGHVLCTLVGLVEHCVCIGVCMRMCARMIMLGALGASPCAPVHAHVTKSVRVWGGGPGGGVFRAPGGLGQCHNSGGWGPPPPPPPPPLPTTTTTHPPTHPHTHYVHCRGLHRHSQQRDMSILHTWTTRLRHHCGLEPNHDGEEHDRDHDLDCRAHLAAPLHGGRCVFIVDAYVCVCVRVLECVRVSGWVGAGGCGCACAYPARTAAHCSSSHTHTWRRKFFHTSSRTWASLEIAMVPDPFFSLHPRWVWVICGW